MLKYFLVLVLVGLVGCMTPAQQRANQRKAGEEMSEEQMQEFNRGLDYLEKEDYPAALRVFDKLLVEKPASELDLIILYDSGAALEGMGQCAKAAQRYRQVARGAVKKFPRMQGEALYRLSYTYECLGEDQKVIAALLDVKKFENEMPQEVSKAEAPARLAAAYARIENRTQAKAYFAQAERGLQDLQSQIMTKKKATEVSAKTLFFMGRLNSLEQQASKKTEDYIESLITLQPFLIRSASLDVAPWSEKAAEQILNAYKRLVEILDSTKVQQDPKDADMNEHLTRTARISLLKFAVQAIEDLKTKKIPGLPQKGSLEERVYNQLLVYEKQIHGLLEKSSELQLKTPEARKREGLKREGRIKDKHP